MILTGSKFGLKRDRRKLNIEPLHLPPEESRAFVNSNNNNSNKEDIVVDKSLSVMLSSSKVSNDTVDKHSTCGHQHDEIQPSINISKDDLIKTNPSPLSMSLAALKAARNSNLDASSSNIGVSGNTKYTSASVRPVVPISISNYSRTNEHQPVKINISNYKKVEKPNDLDF